MKRLIVFLLIILFMPIFIHGAIVGDVNGDNVVNAIDTILTVKHMINKEKLTGDSLRNADVNGDGVVNTLDYMKIVDIILHGPTTPTESQENQPTDSQETPISTEKVTVTFTVGSFITTGYEGNEVLIRGGNVSAYSSSKILNLKKNQKYAVFFDYYTKGGTNKFDVDIYPDSITRSYPKSNKTIQVNLTASTKTSNYVWIFASNDNKITGSDVALRFFDDIRESNEKDIVIKNILMSSVSSKTYNSGSKLGTLTSPTRVGYKFLGWYTDLTGGTKVTSETKVTKDMTLYPHWELDETYTEGAGQGYYSRTVTYMGKTFKDYKQNRMPGAIPTQGCGPVALLDIISGYNDKITINQVVQKTNLSTSFTNINAAARSFGLTHSKLYVYKSSNPNTYTLKTLTETAIKELKKGHQLIVLVARSNMCKNGVCNGWPYDAYSWGNHFIAIIGVKKDNEHVIIFNPMESKMEEGRMEDIIRYYLPGGPQSGFVSYWK